MKKRVISIALICTLGLGITGCLDNGDEISCSEATVQDILTDILKPELPDKIYTKKYLNGDYGKSNFMLDAMVQGAGGFENLSKNPMFKLMEDSKDKKENIFTKILNNYKEFKEKFKTTNILYDSFLTTSKDKELSKVICKATATVVIDNSNYKFDLQYNAQLTDDKKEVYVEVTSFDMK